VLLAGYERMGSCLHGRDHPARVVAELTIATPWQPGMYLLYIFASSAVHFVVIYAVLRVVLTAAVPVLKLRHRPINTKG